MQQRFFAIADARKGSEGWTSQKEDYSAGFSTAMKKLIISSAIILAAVGIAWLISIGGWFFLTILVVLVVIPIALGLCLLKMLLRMRTRKRR